MQQRTLTSRLIGAGLAAVPFVALALVVYFAAVGREQEVETQLVVVESGDTLTSIGRRFGVRPDEIAALNGMRDPSRIYPNQVLLVPTRSDARLPRTPAERVRALTQVPPGVEARRWRTIVVHHSASAAGSARSINAFHTYVRRWPNGLGYHFVIGNGTATPDGFIEAGPRWAMQLHGAHAKSPGDRMNQTGISICLVGNFQETEPTDAQMEALVVLVRRLQRRYNIPTRNVIGHRDVIKGYTVCPGRHFSIERLRERL
jgi:LysM repeat protein